MIVPGYYFYGTSCHFELGKVVGLTGFVIFHVFIASFSPAQGERNQIANANFTRPVNAMPMSNNRASQASLLFPVLPFGAWPLT